MKKLVAAIAMVSLSTTAIAGAKVYGRIDAGVASMQGVGSSDSNLTGLAYGPLSSSRWGIKGKEDLGGGWKATFKLESELHNDTGRAGGNNKRPSGVGDVFWKRHSTVGLKGPFGSIDAGMMKSLDKIRATKYSMLGANFGGFKTYKGIKIGDRVENSLTWHSPKLGPAKVAVQYGFGETVGDFKSNSRLAAALDFKLMGQKATVYYSTQEGATGTDWSQIGVGVAANVKDFVVKGGYVQLNNDTASESFAKADATGYHVSAAVPLSSHTKAYAGYNYTTSDDDKGASGYQLAMLHNLSKKTTLYAMYASVNNEDNGKLSAHKKGLSAAPIAGGDSSGFVVGMRLKF
jgi:predicted porin